MRIDARDDIARCEHGGAGRLGCKFTQPILPRSRPLNIGGRR